MVTFFISGANRGIGLAITTKLVGDSSNTVIGTYRTLTKELQALEAANSNLHLIKLDVSADLAAIKHSLTAIESITSGVDVVIQNSGVLVQPETEDLVDLDSIIANYETNFLGSAKVYNAIEKYWLKDTGVKKQFLFVSSYVGSMSVPMFARPIGYGSSKAAVNYLMVSLDQAAKASKNEVLKSAVIMAIHPGLVRSDMGNKLLERLGTEFPSLSTEESAGYVLKLVEGKEEHGGKLVNYDGTIIPF